MVVNKMIKCIGLLWALIFFVTMTIYGEAYANEGGIHEVLLDDRHSFYINGKGKNSIINTNEKPKLKIKNQPLANIIVEKDSPIFNREGTLIGEIKKGNEYILHSIENDRAVIQLDKKLVYADLENFKHTNLVNPKKNISFHEMEYILRVFSQLYPEFTELKKIGASVEERPLYALKIGKGNHEIIMDGSMHAREHMTTNVLLEMMDEYLRAYVEGQDFDGYDVRHILNQVSIWFVPMMNPDGVTLVQTGENTLPENILMNNGLLNFNRWKANIRGVDLNRNFDGGWMITKTSKYPSYKDYKGKRAFSEPETKALKDFVSKHQFKSYISYHSSGSVIFYYHHQKGEQLKRDLSLAKKLSDVTGYRVMEPTGDTGSGASADWFIMTYKMPGITIEIAPHVKESVVPIKYWDRVWNENKIVGLLAAKDVLTRYR